MKASKLFIKYMGKINFRFVVLIFIVVLYFVRKEVLDFTRISFRTYEFHWMDIFWFILLVEMLIQVNPKSILSKGCLKQFPNFFMDTKVKYTKEELKLLIKNKDKGALKVLLFWVALNTVVGILYYKNIIGVEEIVLTCGFYYVSDLICIIFFCPFQSFFMKNKCCVTCRVFAWGNLMMTTPLIFIVHPYSLSLVGVAFYIAVQWEYTYRKYPERFFEQTNANLKCKNCTDKLCKVKKTLKL